jgi:hypothetical protein
MRDRKSEGRHGESKGSCTDRNRLWDIPRQDFEIEVFPNAEKLKS